MSSFMKSTSRNLNSDEVRIDKGTRHSRRRGVPPLRTMLTVQASARRSHRDRICNLGPILAHRYPTDGTLTL